MIFPSPSHQDRLMAGPGKKGGTRRDVVPGFYAYKLERQVLFSFFRGLNIGPYRCFFRGLNTDRH
jgi:hypothetical protein